MSDVAARYLGLTANQLAKIATDFEAENARLREQAIAATLGSCNCSNNCTDSERTGTCHITPQFACSECGHQYPTRNYEYYETCDGRSAYAPLGYYVLDCKKPNFCPNCGRKVVSK